MSAQLRMPSSHQESSTRAIYRTLRLPLADKVGDAGQDQVDRQLVLQIEGGEQVAVALVEHGTQQVLALGDENRDLRVVCGRGRHLAGREAGRTRVSGGCLGAAAAGPAVEQQPAPAQ